MRPHPYYQAILDAYAAAGRPYFHQSTPAEARSMLKASLAAAPPPNDLPALETVSDEAIEGPHGLIPIRRYLPRGGARGACVYLHAGGWVIGDLDFSDATCRRLAGLAGCEIISVDYRLAPEHPYPQPLDDAWAALWWAAARPGPLLLMGESAGGNLAAACAIRARDAGGPPLAGLALAYPVTDFALDTASHRDVGGRNWLLSTADMRWFWDHYAPAPIDRSDPLLSPLRVASAKGLPPTFICAADLDPLRDEGLAFGAKLAKAGVPVETRVDAGMLHGYLGGAGAVPLAREALGAVAHWIAVQLDRFGIR